MSRHDQHEDANIMGKLRVTRRAWTRGATALLLSTALLARVPRALADAPLDLRWKDLVPKGEAPASKPKTFFSGSTPPDALPSANGDPSAPPPPPMPEGKFMQMKRRQPGAGAPPRVVSDLNGKSVRLGGYVVPLDFEATNIKEFLLVPFVGACIHVPPPPANQIVYVKVEKGFDVAGSFDPVTVTGIIKADVAITGLADAGYTMEAISVEPRTE